MFIVFEENEGVLPNLAVELHDTEIEFGIMHESYSLNKAQVIDLIRFLESAISDMEDD